MFHAKLPRRQRRKQSRGPSGKRNKARSSWLCSAFGHWEYFESLFLAFFPGAWAAWRAVLRSERQPQPPEPLDSLAHQGVLRDLVGGQVGHRETQVGPRVVPRHAADRLLGDEELRGR